MAVLRRPAVRIGPAAARPDFLQRPALASVQVAQGLLDPGRFQSGDDVRQLQSQGLAELTRGVHAQVALAPHKAAEAAGIHPGCLPELVQALTTTADSRPQLLRQVDLLLAHAGILPAGRSLSKSGIGDSSRLLLVAANSAFPVAIWREEVVMY